MTGRAERRHAGRIEALHAHLPPLGSERGQPLLLDVRITTRRHSRQRPGRHRVHPSRRAVGVRRHRHAFPRARHASASNAHRSGTSAGIARARDEHHRASSSRSALASRTAPAGPRKSSVSTTGSTPRHRMNVLSFGVGARLMSSDPDAPVDPLPELVQPFDPRVEHRSIAPSAPPTTSRTPDDSATGGGAIPPASRRMREGTPTVVDSAMTHTPAQDVRRTDQSGATAPRLPACIGPFRAHNNLPSGQFTRAYYRLHHALFWKLPEDIGRTPTPSSDASARFACDPHESEAIRRLAGPGSCGSEMALEICRANESTSDPTRTNRSSDSTRGCGVLHHGLPGREILLELHRVRRTNPGPVVQREDQHVARRHVRRDVVVRPTTKQVHVPKIAPPLGKRAGADEDELEIRQAPRNAEEQLGIEFVRIDPPDKPDARTRDRADVLRLYAGCRGPLEHLVVDPVIDQRRFRARVGLLLVAEPPSSRSSCQRAFSAVDRTPRATHGPHPVCPRTGPSAGKRRRRARSRRGSAPCGFATHKEGRRIPIDLARGRSVA